MKVNGQNNNFYTKQPSFGSKPLFMCNLKRNGKQVQCYFSEILPEDVNYLLSNKEKWAGSDFGKRIKY